MFLRVRVTVFNVTQQYFLYIVAVSFIDGGNRSTWRKPQTCCKSLTNYHILLYQVYLSWTWFEPTLVVIGTYCIGSCKSNYHTITIMTAPTCFLYHNSCLSSFQLKVYFMLISHVFSLSWSSWMMDISIDQSMISLLNLKV